MSSVLQNGESAEQLAEKSRAGCLDSFEELVRIHQAGIYSYLLQFIGNPSDAEDLAQETFVKAYQGLGRYDARYRFSTWLFAIAKHTAISHLRKRRPEVRGEEIEHHAPASEVAGASDGSIWMLAQTLKPKLYEVLWLHYVEDFSVKEIAVIMKTNSVYVKVLLHRARKALKDRLKPEGKFRNES